MGTRDLLLLIGFLRSGKMFPAAVPFKALPAQRSLRLVHDSMAEQERALFGPPPRPADRDDIKRRAALTSWSGELIMVGTRIGEVPDPGVLLCLLYDVPTQHAPLPVEIFAQTLRRYALRDQALRARFEEHVDEAGTYVPAWLSPEVRRQRSQEAFDAAMRVARAQGFAHAAPLFEGVRGECFAPAQLAIAVYELRELGDAVSAMRRLNEVVRIAPRNVAARMQRARILLRDGARQVEAANDYLAVLRELARPDTPEPSREVRDAAMQGLWKLNAEFADPQGLDAAVKLSHADPERGLEALSRYVHTHPCAWEAQAHLASLALSRQRFDLTAKLLASVRWLYPDEPNPHFVYGQALASKGNLEAAIAAFEHAARLAPNDADIQRWIAFARKKLRAEQGPDLRTSSVSLAHHVARSLLVLLGVVRQGRIHPSAMALNKLPGDVSLAFILHGVVTQEQRRFGPTSDARPAATGEIDLKRVSARAALMDYAGEPLDTDQTVGDVPDPGVVIAILYEPQEGGHVVREPPPLEARQALARLAQEDGEMATKLDRHLRSTDAAHKARLDLDG